MERYVINTESGKIRGYEKAGMIEYLGIPFAEPPVGELRLKRAVPVKPWEGILDAGRYGEPSVQEGGNGGVGSEDCLTLNIRRPLLGENFPVLVYIHGGGYNSGTAASSLFDGESFVKNDIVYITIQYRLGVWGFYDFTGYPEGEGFDSNCGISDHVAALKWIHENIRSFGGDPGRITIAGESAGAISVIVMMAIPELKGTFQQVISSSSLPNAVFSKEMAKENMDLFLEGMGWRAVDLTKLRNIGAYEVLKGNQYVAKMHQNKNPGIFLPAPTIDDLLPERPIDAIRKGSAKDIRLMIGTNLHEGTMFVRQGGKSFPNSWESIEEMFLRHGYQEEYVKLKRYYEENSHGCINGIKECFIQFATDYMFQVPSIQVAAGQKEYNDVYVYRFEYVPKAAKESGMMCAHALDIPFDFNKAEGDFYELIMKEDFDVVKKLMDEVHMSWVRFIKWGKPNQGIWPEFKGLSSPVRIFDKESRTEEMDYTELMDVWKDMRFY